MKTFDFYWNDLTKECQKKLFEFLGGENGNYDVSPFATLEVEEDKNEEDYNICISVEGYYNWSGKASNSDQAKSLALNAASEEDFGVLEDVDFNIVSVENE